MTDRLTNEMWAECERIAERLDSRITTFTLDAHSPPSPMDCIPVLVAEVRELRAALVDITKATDQFGPHMNDELHSVARAALEGDHR